MIAQIEGLGQFQKGKKELINTCISLSKRMTIAQIKEKVELINTTTTDEFWKTSDSVNFEKVRVELRDLIKFLMDDGPNKNPIYANLKDDILMVKEGDPLDPAYDFIDYKLKVNRYNEQHKDHIAIHKLRNDIQLTTKDYQSLEHILTGELGTFEDYKREYQDTPFGLLVRKIAKMEYEAAIAAFSEFINDQSLNQSQIVFVKKIINNIVQNGYIDSVAELMRLPFDKPQSFIKLFDGAKQKQIVEAVTTIKDNAVSVIG